MKTVTSYLNGKKIQCRPETTIFEAAKQLGIYIPSLCRHPDLKPYGACRLCIVEDEKCGRLIASCVTPVSDGQKISTDSERVILHRRNIIRLMMTEHSESCLLCSKGNRCLLRKIAGELGVGEHDLYPLPFAAKRLEEDSFIQRDHGKCILCGKCIRVCRELIGCGVFDFSKRGIESRPETVLEKSMEASGCTYCGACIAACPTGALSKLSEIRTGTPFRVQNSVCGFCGSGCSITLGISGRQVVDVKPSQEDSTVNGLSLCIKGGFGFDYLNSERRLKEPELKKEGRLTPVTWEEAFKAVSERLRTISDIHGPQSIGFYGSSKCTNEENYIFQHLARVGIGTPNIDNGGSGYGAGLIKELDVMTSGLIRSGRFSDIGKSDIIIVIGSSPGRSMPVLNYHIIRAASEESRLILLGSEFSDLKRFATHILQPDGRLSSADSAALILSAIGSDICRSQKEDLQYISLFTRQYEELLGFLESFEMADVSRMTGISEERLKIVAGDIAGKSVSFVIGTDILTQKSGKKAVNALLNLSLLTGSLGGFGGNIYPVAPQCNMTGAMDMGTLTDFLPGRYNADAKDTRLFFNKLWQTSMPEKRGLDFNQMLKAAEEGRLKALYIMGENPIRTHPGAYVEKALSSLEFLVVQDILMTETAAAADLLLPGAASAEKSGSFTSMEGRVQTFTRAVEPPGEAISDFEIISSVSEEFGIKPRSLSEIREEISNIPLYNSVSLKGKGGWISRPDSEDYNGDDGKDLKISFTKVEAEKEIYDEEKNLLTAVMDQPLNHAGSGTRTSLSPNMKMAPWKGDALISERIGRLYNIEDGDMVRIYSDYGEIERRISIKSGVGFGIIYLFRGFKNNDLMNLLEPGSMYSGSFRVGVEKIEDYSQEDKEDEEDEEI